MKQSTCKERLIKEKQNNCGLVSCRSKTGRLGRTRNAHIYIHDISWALLPGRGTLPTITVNPYPSQGGSIRLHKAWREIIFLAALGKHLGVSLASDRMGIPLFHTTLYFSQVGYVTSVHNLSAKVGWKRITRMV